MHLPAILEPLKTGINIMEAPAEVEEPAPVEVMATPITIRPASRLVRQCSTRRASMVSQFNIRMDRNEPCQRTRTQSKCQGPPHKQEVRTAPAHMDLALPHSRRQAVCHLASVLVDC